MENLAASWICAACGHVAFDPASVGGHETHYHDGAQTMWTYVEYLEWSQEDMVDA